MGRKGADLAKSAEGGEKAGERARESKVGAEKARERDREREWEPEGEEERGERKGARKKWLSLKKSSIIKGYLSRHLKVIFGPNWAEILGRKNTKIRSQIHKKGRNSALAKSEKKGMHKNP